MQQEQQREVGERASKKALVKNHKQHPDLLLKDRDDWKKLFIGNHFDDCPKNSVLIGFLPVTVNLPVGIKIS